MYAGFLPSQIPKMKNIGLCIFKKNIPFDIMSHSCLGAYLVPVNFLDLLDARIRTAANFYIDL